MNKSSKQIIWIVGLIGITLASFLSYIGLSEFFHVAIQKNIDMYPWGLVNMNPWYYTNSTVYVSYSLITGVFYLCMSIFTLIGLIKLKLKRTILGTGITIMIFSIMMISAAIF